MNTTSNKRTLAILFALFALMAATRSHHFAAITHLPDASWAVFFLAGVYLGRSWIFAALLGLAGVSDYLAIGWFGVSDYCISAAYPLLIPAYGALWLAGRWYAGRHRMQWSNLPFLALAVLAGAALCELVSGASFYLLSGRTAEPTLAGYATQFLDYLPSSLLGMSLYVAMAGLVHVVLHLTTDIRPHAHAR